MKKSAVLDVAKLYQIFTVQVFVFTFAIRAELRYRTVYKTDQLK